MNINTIQAVYFIGAGGIGMSALVRYFLSKGKKVGGYDRTPTGARSRPPRWWSIRLPFPQTIKNWFISRNISLKFTNVPKYWEC